MKASGLEHVIFRPSFVFGAEGGALGQFKKIAKLAPVTPIVGPGTQRIQPIWVEDVAAYFAAGVEKPEAANRTFELGGPDVVTWNEFWSRLKQALGSRRPSIHLPFGLMRAQAAVLEKLPKPPVTRDQLKMLAAGDNVVSNSDAVDTFGLPLVPLDEQLPPRDRRRTDRPGTRRRAAFAALRTAVPACIGRDASCRSGASGRPLPAPSASPLRWLDDSPCRS